MTSKYPWPHPKPITDAGESLRVAMVTDSRDWSIDKRDAWLYGIIVGWKSEEGKEEGEDPLAELALKHNWTPETIDRLKMLHEQFQEKFPEYWDANKEHSE